MTTTKGNSSRYTENWVPVQSIASGMILLNNQEKVTGVKIAPKNIFIMDYESQQATLMNLRNMYNQIDFEFWLIVADRPVDISVYMSQLQLLYNQESSPAIRKLIAEDLAKCNSFINNNEVPVISAKDNNTISKFFEWVTMSVSVRSVSSNPNQAQLEDVYMFDKDEIIF